MTNDDLHHIRRLIGDVDLGALQPDRIEELERRVSPGLMDNSLRMELRVAVAMSVLTPDLDWGSTADQHHAAIVAHAALLNRAVDCAITYGLGWRRKVETGRPTTLYHRWPRAFSWMLFQFAEAVVEANRFLADSVNCLQMAGGLEYLENTDTV